MATTTATKSTTGTYMDYTGATTGTTSTYENPNAKLDKDAFMKLFLEQLKYQDPTQPMDTATIMQQTAQMTAIEQNENMKSVLTSVQTALSNQSQFSAVNLIGRSISTGDNTLKIASGGAKIIETILPENAQSVEVKIKDDKGTEVRTYSNGAKMAGPMSIYWDAKNTAGTGVKDGTYTVSTTYIDVSGAKKSIDLTQTIESVQFSGTTAKVKTVNNDLLDLSSIKTIL